MDLGVGVTHGPARGTVVGLELGVAIPKLIPPTHGRSTDTAVTQTIPTATAITTNPAIPHLNIQTNAIPATHTATGICQHKL
jgi:hypothetical protein